MNGDDKELSVDFVLDSAGEEDDDDDDDVPAGDAANGPDEADDDVDDPSSEKVGSKRSRVYENRPDPGTISAAAEKEKVLPEQQPMNGDGGGVADNDDDDIIVLSPPKPKKPKTLEPPQKEKTPKPQPKPQPKQPQKKNGSVVASKNVPAVIAGGLEPADYQVLFNKMRFYPTTRWMGKDLLFWISRMAFVRECAVKQNQEWHDAHPPLLTPEWHIFSHVRWAIHCFCCFFYWSSA